MNAKKEITIAPSLQSVKTKMAVMSVRVKKATKERHSKLVKVMCYLIESYAMTVLYNKFKTDHELHFSHNLREIVR